MKRFLRLVLAGSLVAAVVSAPISASAHDSFGDPYEDGPLASRWDVDWCSPKFGSYAEYVADLASYAIDYAYWYAVESWFGVPAPPVPEFDPTPKNAAGCARAKQYDTARAQRAAILRDFGEDVALWQNRPAPNLLDSSETPPDFVLVGFGDSFASGEGNPAEGTTWRNDNYRDVTWTTFSESRRAVSESDDPADAAVCHRSSASGIANAMMELRRQYSAINIYWRNFACSGAETRHLWKDTYVPWKFFQVQDVAGVGPSTSDGDAFLAATSSPAVQDTQINQANRWLNSFAHQRPELDATYMSIGGNDVFFGPVIGECVSPVSTSGCSSSNVWLQLAKAALNGTMTPPDTDNDWYSDFTSPGSETIDPLAGSPGIPGIQCTRAQIAYNGCISHTNTQRWSSARERYDALEARIRQSLAPNQVYLAEVPDFTRSDNGTSFCGDVRPSWDSDSVIVANDPYLRMDSDWLLSNSEFDDWQYAAQNVGQGLVDAIRSVAKPDGGGPYGWRLVSKGPKGDTLFEGWRKKHGVCALSSFVNTFEEAQDTQGEDLDNALDVSAGSMHPNAFGQQDYAERILFAIEGQLVKKMTPTFTASAPLISQTPLGISSTTLGGGRAQDTTITVPWTLKPYPNGDDRVDMFVRVTPITAVIKPVNLAGLVQPQSISYKLDYTKTQLIEAKGDDAGVDVVVPALSAGAQIEIRGCGPASYPGDARLCTKWQSSGHYLRSPANLFDPKAYARIRALERSMSDARFRQGLKSAVTRLSQPGVVNVATSATASSPVRFDWATSLGLTPASIRDNAWKPTPPRPSPVPQSTYDTPVIPRGTTEADLVDCGVPEEAAGRVLQGMRPLKRGSLLVMGHQIANCLEFGDSVSPWPYEPPSGDTILESECDLTPEEFDELWAAIDDPKTDPGVFEDTWEHAGTYLRCLQDQGVTIMDLTSEERADLSACGLTPLDLPLVTGRFSPPLEAQEAINCLRGQRQEPPLYWYFLTDP